MTPKSLQYHFTRIFFTFSFVLNDLFHIFSNNNKTTISKNNIASLRHLFLHQNSSLGTFLSITQWAELVYSGTALVEPLSALGAPNPAGLLFYTSSWVLLEAEGADDDVVEGQLLKGLHLRPSLVGSSSHKSRSLEELQVRSRIYIFQVHYSNPHTFSHLEPWSL